MEAVGFILLAAWLIMGAWGMVIMYRKGYLGFFRNVRNLGCLAWILYGWIVGFIVVYIPVATLVGLGGITLLIARSLPSKIVPAGSYTPRSSQE